MIKELGELNEKFYELFGRLHKNKSLLAVKPEQIQFMAAALFNQYKAEYKLLAMRAEIRERRQLYDAELRHYFLVPRKRLFFIRNRAMKQLDAKIIDELEAWFKQHGQSEACVSVCEDLPLDWEEQKKEPVTVVQSADSESDQTEQSAEQIQSEAPQSPSIEQAVSSEPSEALSVQNAAVQASGQ